MKLSDKSILKPLENLWSNEMENRINYIMLGIFVFGLFLGALGFVLWMGKYSEKDSFTYYKVNTKESVSGLNDKAPVKLHGVAVGEVYKIFINPKNSEEVSIIIKIKAETPIKKDTHALIEPQGITGLSYLQLEGGSHDAEVLPTSENESEMGIIYTEPSLFSRVDQSLTTITEKSSAVLTSTDRVLQKANQVLSDKNLQNIERILENSAQLSESVHKTAQSLEMQRARIDSIMKQALLLENAAIDTANRMREMSDTISGIVKTTGVETMDKMSTAADSVRLVMKKIEDKFDSGMFDFDTIAKDALSPAENTLIELETLMVQTQKLLEGLQESPSDLLYKSTPVEPGPGEGR